MLCDNDKIINYDLIFLNNIYKNKFNLKSSIPIEFYYDDIHGIFICYDNKIYTVYPEAYQYLDNYKEDLRNNILIKIDKDQIVKEFTKNEIISFNFFIENKSKSYILNEEYFKKLINNEITETSEYLDYSNYQDSNGNIPLMMAINLNNLDIVKQILTVLSPDKLNIKNDEGDTALMIAIQKENLDIVNAILEKSPNLNIQNDEGDTALMIAIQKENLDIVNAILEKSPNLNIENDKGHTALMIAIKKHNLNIVNAIEVFNRIIKRKRTFNNY